MQKLKIPAHLKTPPPSYSFRLPRIKARTSRDGTVKDLLRSYDKLTKTQRYILGYLLRAISNQCCCYVSHEHIAKRVGCSRRTVLRAISVLTENFVVVRRRTFSTNLYSFNDRLNDKQVRVALSRYVHGLLNYSKDKKPLPQVCIKNVTLLKSYRFKRSKLYVGDSYCGGVRGSSRLKNKGKGEGVTIGNLLSGVTLVYEGLSSTKRAILSWCKPTRRLLVELEAFSDAAVLYASKKVKQDRESGVVLYEMHRALIAYCLEFMKLSEETPAWNRVMALRSDADESRPWFEGDILPETKKTLKGSADSTHNTPNVPFVENEVARRERENSQKQTRLSDNNANSYVKKEKYHELSREKRAELHAYQAREQRESVERTREMLSGYERSLDRCEEVYKAKKLVEDGCVKVEAGAQMFMDILTKREGA